ncbi:MAG: DMT family transporter [Bacteroidales bacterium]|nr:DMT family transporter [Bacteroidales bacterium]
MIKTGDASFKGHFSLLVAYIIFGLSAPIGKSAMMEGGIAPLSLTFFRMAGAALLFWIASLLAPRERVAKKDLLLLLGASTFGVIINQICYIGGLAKTSPVDASLIATLGPIITMLVAAVYLKEPITFKKVLGVLVGAAGVLLLIITGINVLNGESHASGNLLVLTSGFSFAIYLTVFRDVVRRYSSVTVMKWMFLYATIICTPLCFKHVSAIDYGALSFSVYWKIAFVVCCATFISYMLLPVGQKRLRPTIVSMYNYLQPIVSSGVAVAMGLDVFGWSKGASTVLVFLGVYIVTRSKSRAQVEAGIK